jgi:hypothetical protein
MISLYKIVKSEKYDYCEFADLFLHSEDVEGHYFECHNLPKCTSIRKRKKRIKKLFGKKVFFVNSKNYNKLWRKEIYK